MFDYNTIWNGGKEPIRTGMKGYRAVGADRTDRIPNREFPAASEEQLKHDANQTAAQGWFWYHKQYPDVKSEVVTDNEGKRALRLAAAHNPEKKYIQYACARSDPFMLEPGKDYRLTFKLLTQRTSGATTVATGQRSERAVARVRIAEFRASRQRSGPNTRLPSTIRPRAKTAMTRGWGS